MMISQCADVPMRKKYRPLRTQWLHKGHDERNLVDENHEVYEVELAAQTTPLCPLCNHCVLCGLYSYAKPLKTAKKPLFNPINPYPSSIPLLSFFYYSSIVFDCSFILSEH